MNIREHLLVILMEECAEVQQAVSKALRFGTVDIGPDEELTNAQNIEREFIEAMAVRDMLKELGVISDLDDTKAIYENKKRRVEKYVEYARSCGTIK